MDKNTSIGKPLIVAAYVSGDSGRKRRIKVPAGAKWSDFLALLYSRLELNPGIEIEVFDEEGIEIVSVEDLVENDVLVVREKGGKVRKSEPQLYSQPRGGGVVPRDIRGSSHDPAMLLRAPVLSHFIQSNSFGYYFLAEVENVKIVSSHGDARKTHCVIKVPLVEREIGTLQTFEIEASLLRKISDHKSIVSPPNVQIINFCDPMIQPFYKSLPQAKRVLVQDLFTRGGYLEAYMYPLYGVTMATKIRSGISPDKVLKYSYQLADVMYYLQRRGVIHLNLLPENIQVMSNDRVIICNFETAVQTDPTTCLLVASTSTVAPSNKKGLAPEVITALSCLRIETETVDYSTQYPWSFGLLSAIMSTGVHPLNEYPEYFESSFRIKYRSHHFQALPDPEQYPPIFCKLLKRSLSCDPVRRPTLPQIISIIKKDSRILSIMSKGRMPQSDKPGGEEMVSAAQTRPPNRGLYDSVQHSDHGLLSNKPHPSPSRRGFHETHPPPSYGFSPHPREQQSDHLTRSSSHEQAQRDHMTRSSSHEQAQRDHMTQVLPTQATFESIFTLNSAKSRDLEPANQIDPFEPKHPRWDNFSDPVIKHNTKEKQLVLRRQGSQGNFSDDFVSPKLSRESSGQTTRKHTASSGEYDLNEVQDVPYQRLIPSPNAQSSDDRASPLPQASGASNSYYSSPKALARNASLHASSPKLMPKSTSSEASATRRVEQTREGDGMSGFSKGEEKMDTEGAHERHVTPEESPDPHMPQETQAGDNHMAREKSHDQHMTFQEFDHEQQDIHMQTQSEDSPIESILMSTSTHNTQTTTTSYNLTSQSRDSPESMDTHPEAPPTGRGLLSPIFSNNDQSLKTNKQFWAGVMNEYGTESNVRTGSYLFSLDELSLPTVEAGLNDTPTSLAGRSVFPGAFAERDSVATAQRTEASPVVVVQSDQVSTAQRDEDLTPKDDCEVLGEIPTPILGTVGNTSEISRWVQSSSMAEPSSNSEPVYTTARNYLMSPIPEASQELTSSMSQSMSQPNRISAQFRSVSPISEVTSSCETRPSLSPENQQPQTRPRISVENQEMGNRPVLSIENQEIQNSATTGNDESTVDICISVGETEASDVSGNSRETASADHVSSSESIPSSARAQVGGASPSQSHTQRTPTNDRLTPSPRPDSADTAVSERRGAMSPQSTISAPPTFSRPLSPLATTAHRSTEILNSIEQENENPNLESESGTRWGGMGMRSVVSESGVSRFPTSRADNQMSNVGIGTENRGELESEIRPKRGSASRFRYSQQRQTDPSRQQSQKISQDLEMMNLAISGLDSIASSLTGSANSEPPLTRDRHSPPQASRRSNTTLPYGTRGQPSPKQLRPDRANRHGNGATRQASRALRRVEPSGHTQREGTRAPVSSGSVRAPSADSRGPGSVRAPSAENRTGSHSPGSSTQLPVSTAVLRRTSTSQPPQVTADSYDYLPPYSPPRPDDTQQRHASEPSIVAEAPPSYDEIFGSRDRRNKRNERSRFSRRSQSHREPDEEGGEQSSQNGRSSSRPTSRRLISLSNLFKRSRKHSQTDTPEPTEPAPASSSGQDPSEFTADWVASYSRTPRPFSVQDNLSTNSTGSVSSYPASSLTRAFSDVSNTRSSETSSNNPVPYRNPPPFPSTENLLTSASTVSRSYPPPQNGSSQSLNVSPGTRRRIPVRVRPGSHMSNHGRSHVRQQRPASAYGPHTSQPTSAGSTPRIASRQIVSSDPISNSCFNITSPVSPDSPGGLSNAPRMSRERRVVDLTSQTTSTGSNLSINANANNINARASPRASLTSSPVTASTPNILSQSPIASQFPAASSLCNLVGSQDATPVASSPSTIVNGGASQSSVRSGEDIGGRVSVRQRAESRRLAVQSSSEEEHTSEVSLSQNSQRSKVRRRRHRRSIDAGYSSTSLNPLQERSPEPIASSHDPGVPENTSRSTEERDTQSIEVTIESVGGSAIEEQNKSCGHSCDSGDQVLCCVCTAEQREATIGGDETLDSIQLCSQCQRRGSSSNLIINKHGQTSGTGQSTDLPTNSLRAGKNCRIM